MRIFCDEKQFDELNEYIRNQEFPFSYARAILDDGYYFEFFGGGPKWLLGHCPITWVTDAIRNQIGPLEEP